MSAFLDIQNVSVHFTKKHGLIHRTVETIRAVDDVSLAVSKGEILGLVGESGCGKTTLSRAVMQLIRSTSGRVILDGVDLTCAFSERLRAERHKFQMVFQDPYASLNPRMTVFTTLREALETRGPLRGKEALARIRDLLLRVGLDPRFMMKYPHEFSGGQRQRIAIARALAPEPRLLMADEPVSALDVSIQSQIINLLLKLTREMNLTMIFISHDLSVVRYIADRIAVMQAGKIVELGAAEDVMDRPQHAYTKSLLASVPRIDLTAMKKRLAS